MESASAEEAEAIAERITSITDLSAAAWQAQYAAASRRGDIAGMLETKYYFLCLNRYWESDWTDFTELLEMAAT